MIVANTTPPPWPPAEPYTPADPCGPTCLTDHLRDALVCQLERGLPVGVACAPPGWPTRRTVRIWRDRHPAFDQAVTDAQARGCRYLVDATLAEVAECEKSAGRAAARHLLHVRHSQLAAAHPAHFAGGAWSRSTEKRLGVNRVN